MTAETAVLLPVLAMVLVLCLWGLSMVALQVRCTDAARTTARALARGESEARAREVGRALAPSRAELRLTRSGDLATVEVRLDGPAPWGWAGGGSGIELGARSVVAVETPP